MQWKNIEIDGRALAAMLGCVLVCALARPTLAGEMRAGAPSEETSSSGVTDPAVRIALFGDLHVHTELSIDAYMMGSRQGPDEAYRFAKGEAILHPAGFTIQLEQPLDFEAVTDHAGYLGMTRAMSDPNSGPGDHPLAVRLRETKNQDERMQLYYDLYAYWDPGGKGGWVEPDPDFVDDLLDVQVVRSAWQEVIDAAERHNQPGTFTTFVGYEYTSSGPARENVHRNVIFRGSRVPSEPFSLLDSLNPEDLWDWMDGLREQGIEALAIPHNSNGSDGFMFAKTDWQDRPIDATYSQQRMRNEPLVEVTQNKGTSETHPLLSPNDEWADFELRESKVATSEPSRPQGSYVRQAYLDGLVMQQARDVNPYRFGLIGASDNHIAAGSFDESNYFGSGALAATAEQRGSVPFAESDDGGPRYNDEQLRSASGLTGVWAESNTRESIYTALRRKETFATSGPRIKVRFFAGYGWDAALVDAADAAGRAYATGVSMGGDLAGHSGEPPTFLVWATRDPASARLQRLQVVKGWTVDGEGHEHVYDVACSDGLAVNPKTQRCPDNGASVRLEDCRITADIGASELRTLWRDPDFDPDQLAFYYVRVLENPTCRWSTWDAIRAGVAPRPNWPATIQERAWSSPIWYLPHAKQDNGN